MPSCTLAAGTRTADLADLSTSTVTFLLTGRRGQPRAPTPAPGFGRFARWTAHAAGHPAAFGLAALTVAVWLATGPLFRVSDTW